MRASAPFAASMSTLLAAACWQPPQEPVEAQPSDAELLALRPYALIAPLELDGGTADSGARWPLLMVLHGFHSTGPQTASYLGLTSEAVRRRYFRIQPRGSLDPGGLSWNPDFPVEPPWDSAYLRAVLLDALSEAPVDPSRVFVVGYSQGAHMAHRLACDSADLVSAVVGVAGQLKDCAPARPVSALVVHGTLDEAISYSGPLGALDTSGLWGRVDGCTGSLEATAEPLDLTQHEGAETTVQSFGGCPEGIGVQLWTMGGVGHSPNWTDDFPTMVTGFLDAHPRP